MCFLHRTLASSLFRPRRFVTASGGVFLFVAQERAKLSNSKIMTRWHLYFSGRVQGVGFRFTCHQVARQFGLFGWVRNLSDGRVEMLVEGSGGDLADAIDQIRNDTYGEIHDMFKEESAATGEFGSFRIIR